MGTVDEERFHLRSLNSFGTVNYSRDSSVSGISEKVPAFDDHHRDLKEDLMPRHSTKVGDQLLYFEGFG